MGTMNDRAAALNELLIELERTWARHTVRSVLKEDAEIDVPGSMLLKAVHEAPGSRSSDIADRCAMSRPVVSRRVASLAHAGLVALAPDPDDRRASLLSTTPRGDAAVERMETDASAALDRLVEDFTLDDLQTLRHLLGRLNDRAVEQQTARPDATHRTTEGDRTE
jgi:DNA-binding MarR family transcriptional regulator